MGEVLVPAVRFARWVDNFASRHGTATYVMADGALRGVAVDGSDFMARLPFDIAYGGPGDAADFIEAVTVPESWGVLLVRKGGFAVARMTGSVMVEHKIGQRHVQGRTKAGGQSQQRFARRRDNQARQAYEAAADHAARLLRPGPVIAGGDRTAVEEVLADQRLGHLDVVGPWLAVPDPRRVVLDQAILDAQAIRVDVTNAT